MSDSTEAAGATERANRALGHSKDVVVAAVEAARQKVAAEKVAPISGESPVVTPGERRDLDRPKVGEAVDKAMGKDREDAVRTVEIAKEALAAKPEPEAKTGEPDEGKVGRMLADVRERERRNVERESNLRKREAEFDGYKKRVEEELTRAREINALASSDPFAFFEKFHGIKRESWGLASNGRRPEENIRDARTENEINTLRQEIQTLRQAREHETREQVRNRELDKFEADARAGGEKWPLSSKYKADKLRERAWNIAMQHAQLGASLSNEEILDRLEEELSEELAPYRESKRESKQAKQVQEIGGSEAKPSQQPTLTSRGSSEAAEAKVLPSKMKRDDMIRRTVDVLEEMKRARAAK